MKWLLSIFILSILSLITKLESSCEESKALRELDASGAHVAIVGSGFVGAAGRRPRGSCPTEVEFATELRHVFRKLRITLVGRRGCSGLGAAERYVENSLETWNLKP